MLDLDNLSNLTHRAVIAGMVGSFIIGLTVGAVLVWMLN